MFAACYGALFAPVLLSCTAVLAFGTLRWLLLSVLLVPVSTALGLWGLLFGLPLIALLVGATALRWPERFAPMLVAAALLPLVELWLVRRHGVPLLGARLLPLLINRSTLIVLGSLAPALASMIAALLVPRQLIRRVLR